MKTVTINVTDADIASGKRGSCGRCPIALAIKRECKTQGVLVGSDIVIINSGSDIQLPPEAVQFVIKFDNREPVQPFTFQLQIP